MWKIDKLITKPLREVGIGVKNMSNSNAPELGRFNNPVTGGILILVIVLIGTGLGISLLHGELFGILLGAIVAGIGGTIWVMGETDHSPDKPKEVGVLTCWDKPITLGKRWPDHIVVVGKVILADYPPFYISSIKIDIQNKERKFSFKVISQDKIVFQADVTVTARADTTDLLDYIQAGNDMEKVFNQISSIVDQDTQSICTLKEAEFLFFNRKYVSDALFTNVSNIFASKSFGVEVIKVQFTPIIPDDVEKKLTEIKTEDWERDKELKDYGTMREAAKKLQREMARELLPVIIPPATPLTDAQLDEAMKPLIKRGELKDLNSCIEMIKVQHLIQAGKVTRVESDGSLLNLNKIT